MGHSESVYVGPYVKVISHPKAIIETFQGCPNEKCGLGKPKSRREEVTSSFCSGCGTPTGALNVENMKHLNHYEVMGDNENLCRLRHELNGDKVLLFGANVKFLKRKLHWDNMEDLMLDKADFDPSVEMSTFLIKFRKEIDMLEKAYGNAEVSWGIIGDVR